MHTLDMSFKNFDIQISIHYTQCAEWLNFAALLSDIITQKNSFVIQSRELFESDSLDCNSALENLIFDEIFEDISLWEFGTNSDKGQATSGVP